MSENNRYERKMKHKNARPKGEGMRAPISKGSIRSKQKQNVRRLYLNAEQYAEDYDTSLWE